MSNDDKSQNSADKGSDDEIAASAAQWLARRGNSEHWTATDEQNLEAWLNADPRHRREFQILETIYQSSGNIQAATEAPTSIATPQSSLAWWVGSAACLLLLAWFSWLIINPGTFHKEYATQIAEIQEINLPDESTVTLDTDTIVRVQFDHEHRLLLLQRGRARFKVQPDAGRPFIVRTYAGDIRVVGTEFEVALTADASEVAVREGEVRLLPRKETKAKQILQGGQGVRFTHEGLASDIRAIQPKSFASWQRGQLVFDNRPLGEVAREVGRYLREDVRVVTATLRRKPISGVFSTRDIGEFFNALQEMLPVRVSRDKDGTILIEPR